MWGQRCHRLEGLTPVKGSWVVPVGDAKGRGNQLHRQEQSRLKSVSVGMSQVPSNRIIFLILNHRRHCVGTGSLGGPWALSSRQSALENGPVPSAPLWPALLWLWPGWKPRLLAVFSTPIALGGMPPCLPPLLHQPQALLPLQVSLFEIYHSQEWQHSSEDRRDHPEQRGRNQGVEEFATPSLRHQGPYHLFWIYHSPNLKRTPPRQTQQHMVGEIQQFQRTERNVFLKVLFLN